MWSKEDPLRPKYANYFRRKKPRGNKCLPFENKFWNSLSSSSGSLTQPYRWQVEWTFCSTKIIKVLKQVYQRDGKGLLRWSRGWLLTLNAGNLSLIPGQGTRACMPQLKIPHAAAKTWGSQINTKIKKKKKKKHSGEFLKMKRRKHISERKRG